VDVELEFIYFQLHILYVIFVYNFV
jgi:hypothetical protein